MNIILLEKSRKLGNLGDKISVKPGYARNYLLPKGKALLATPENMAKVQETRAELEKLMAEKKAEAQVRADSLVGVLLTLAGKTADEGKLYGSLGVRDVVEAIHKATAMTVQKVEVHLPGGPIRMLGEYEVEVHLHPDVMVTMKLNVVAA
jgi:large subunit ribosomal protein L9